MTDPAPAAAWLLALKADKKWPNSVRLTSCKTQGTSARSAGGIAAALGTRFGVDHPNCWRMHAWAIIGVIQAVTHKVLLRVSLVVVRRSRLVAIAWQPHAPWHPTSTYA
jgi:hypothetical protein